MTTTHRTRRGRLGARWVAIAATALIVLLVGAPAAVAMTAICVAYTLPPNWRVENEQKTPDMFELDVRWGFGALSPQAGVRIVQYQYYGGLYATPDEILATIEKDHLGTIPTEYHRTFTGRTTLSGREALYAGHSWCWKSKERPSEYEGCGQLANYFVDLGDSGVVIVVEGSDSFAGRAGVDGLYQQALDVLKSMTFQWQGCSTGVPWKVVTADPVAVGAAVAAAAAVIIGLAPSRRPPKADEPEADLAVGYVLALSARQLGLGHRRPTPLQATVYEVLPTGVVRPSPGTQLEFLAPAGVAVQPAQGTGTMSAQVWQTGVLPPGAALTVRATAARGEYAETVAVIEMPEYEVEFF